MCGPDPLDAAEAFVATHARLLDRLRFEVRFRGAPPDALLAAVEAYRNPDGGYGHGLEPDLRSATSQPGGALHAFEAFADVAPHVTPRAAELCDWCAASCLPNGALPFAFPVPDPAGCAPFWTAADPTEPSLQITAIVAAQAHLVARHDPAVARHPWLADATDYCRAAVADLGEEPFAMAVAFAAQLFDAAGDAAGLDLLRPHVPDDGRLAVAGGSEGETMRPVDFAPGLFTDDVWAADLERLAAGQRPDGGWAVDFASFSPIAELEWRGQATVNALVRLAAGRG